MPNWCINRLDVKGEPERVEEFHRAFCGKPALFKPGRWETYGKTEEEIQALMEERRQEWEELEPQPCFNALYPIPERILGTGYSAEENHDCSTPEQSVADLTNPSKAHDGYTWSISHWGTKWDIYEVEYDIAALVHLGHREYHFDTAWSPPIPWLVKVGQDWPYLRFELVYGECGLCFAGKCTVEGIMVEHLMAEQDGYRDFMIEHMGYDPYEGEE